MQTGADSSKSDSSKANGASVTTQSWIVTLVLCILLSGLGACWQRAATLPGIKVGLCEPVPPVPAVATLVFLLFLQAALRHLGSRFHLARCQIITVYAFVMVSVSLGFGALYRTIPARMAAPDYARGSALAEVKDCVPEWLAPRDPTAIQQFWEGSPDKSVPWDVWLLPLLAVGGILLLFFITTTCLLRLFYSRWSRQERLGFPAAELALDMVQNEGASGITQAAFRARPFWWGAAAALVFNLIFIIPALTESWPVPQPYVDLGFRRFAGTPLAAISMFMVRLNPIIFGLGYLVPMDVLLSIWVCFFAMKVQAIVMVQYGVDQWRLFFNEYKQGVGSYLALTLLMIWAARRQLAQAFRRLLPRAPAPAPDEAGRGTVLLFVGGVIGLLWTMTAAGMNLFLAGVVLGVLLVRALVMSRIRAQAGVAQIWLHVLMVEDLPWIFGGALLGMNGMAGVAGIVFMSFLFQAGYIVPHHADCLRLAERSGLGLRRWMVVGLLGTAVGLVLVNLTHMTAFYEHGALNIITRDLVSWHQPEIRAVRANAPPDWFLLKLASAGFVSTLALAWLRRFHWFPLHPIGFAVACAAGWRSAAIIMMIWLIKWTILKYFGGRVHRRARGFFLGLVMGHFAVATIWALLALASWPPTQRYSVIFW